MLETPHALLGGAVGGLTGNPVAALPAGIASHFAGDFLPHWNPNYPFKSRAEYAFVIGDFLLALALTPVFYFLFPDQPEIAVGAFAGTIPDLLLAGYFVLKIDWLEWFCKFQAKYHNETSLRHGLWPQAIVSLLAVAVLLGF
jgi:hypothetical protein